MKAIRKNIARLVLGCVLALSLTPDIHAQVPDLPPSGTNQPPTPEQLAAQYAAWLSGQWTIYYQEYAPWQHFDARLADGSPASFSQVEQQQMAGIPSKVAALTAANSAELQAGQAQAATLGLAEFGTNQAGGVLALAGTGSGLGFVTSFNTEAADTISTDEVQPGGNTGLGLTGTNTTVGVWEVGLVFTNHLEFTNSGRRVFEMETSSRYSISDHSTHVAGTVAAYGVTNAAKGMAHRAIVRAWDAENDTGEMLSEAFTNRVRVSNHSYGRGCGWAGYVSVSGVPYPFWDGNIAISTSEDYHYGFYDTNTAAIDADAYYAKYYLPVWAAANERGGQGQAPTTNSIWHVTINNGSYVLTYGAHPNDYAANGGYDLLPPQQVCKNGLTIGAVSNIVGGYSGSNGVGMSTFSSWGPTDDGRLKPDLAAAGVNIFSLGAASNTAYRTDSGTSMAAPSVAGSLDLLTQLQSQLYGTNRLMLASTLKGLAIVTADEAGPAAGPDYRFGWGLMNTRAAALLMQSNYASQALAHIKEVRLLSGDIIEFPVVATNNRPLRVRAVWTDPPGTAPAPALDPAAAMLVNDLDLRVVSPAGATNYPWVLNPAAPANAATTGDNTRDNVEGVDIATPANGTYLVRVTHKGQLVNSSNVVSEQTVSILISGNVPQPQPELRLAKPLVIETNTFLRWPSVVGRVYRVQYRNDLGASS